MQLQGGVVAVSELTGSQRDEMYALMSAHYDHVQRATFEADLAEKECVIMLRDERGQVRGFSTQMVLRVSVAGRTVTALFSGDTIVAPEYWAQNPLSRLWGRYALSLIERYDDRPLYWFLISKGYKTYRFLPLFFHLFWPRFDQELPRSATRMLTALGTAKFPQSFDVATGIIRAEQQQCRLRPAVAPIDERRRRDPHVAFFEQRNPGHGRGDELCCLAPLNRQNFTPAAWRVMGLAPS